MADLLATGNCVYNVEGVGVTLIKTLNITKTITLIDFWQRWSTSQPIHGSVDKNVLKRFPACPWKQTWKKLFWPISWCCLLISCSHSSVLDFPHDVFFSQYTIICFHMLQKILLSNFYLYLSLYYASRSYSNCSFYPLIFFHFYYFNFIFHYLSHNCLLASFLLLTELRILRIHVRILTFSFPLFYPVPCFTAWMSLLQFLVNLRIITKQCSNDHGIALVALIFRKKTKND